MQPMTDEEFKAQNKNIVVGERRRQRVKDPQTGEIKEFEVVIKKVAKPKE